MYFYFLESSKVIYFWQHWKKLRRFWSDPVKATAANHRWSIINTDSVLCTLEDHTVLQSLWNTTIATPWQFRLKGLLCKHKSTYLLIYLQRGRTIRTIIIYTQYSAHDCILPPLSSSVNASYNQYLSFNTSLMEDSQNCSPLHHIPSAGASLNEASLPLNYNNWPLIFIFLVVTLLNNNNHTVSVVLYSCSFHVFICMGPFSSHGPFSLWAPVWERRGLGGGLRRLCIYHSCAQP